MSRLETGVLEVDLRPVAPRGGGGAQALASLSQLERPIEDPRVRAAAPGAGPMPGLLERVVANVVVQRPALLTPRIARCASRRARWATGSTCASSTRARAWVSDDRDRVFEPFQRLGDRDQPGRVGLGLAVARGFTDANDGELDVEDTPGGGLTTVISAGRGQQPVPAPARHGLAVPVPDRPDETEARAGGGRESRARHDPRCWWWTTTPDAAGPLHQSAGPSVRGGGGPSGEEALHLAAERHPDVVVLDLGLPGIDGVEVVHGMRGWTTVPSSSCRSATERQQGRGPRRRGRRLHDQALRDERALGPDPGRRPAGADARRGAPVVKPRTSGRPGGQEGDPGRAEVHLTPNEWGLVGLLVRNRGRLVSQRQLLQEVWGPAYETETEYLRVLWPGPPQAGARPPHPRYFLTEPGMGYRFEP